MLKSTWIRRRVALPALGAVLGAMITAGTGAVPAFAGDMSAMAHPSGCTYQIAGNWGAAAWCDHHNGGEFRVTVICKDTDNGKITEYYGPWRQYGVSNAYCQGNSRPITPGLTTRP
jgi:hypothetical protein